MTAIEIQWYRQRMLSRERSASGLERAYEKVSGESFRAIMLPTVHAPKFSIPTERFKPSLVNQPERAPRSTWRMTASLPPLALTPSLIGATVSLS